AALVFVCFFASSGAHRDLHSFPTRRSSDLRSRPGPVRQLCAHELCRESRPPHGVGIADRRHCRQLVSRGYRALDPFGAAQGQTRSEEHTSELQSLAYLVCRLLLEKKKKIIM